MKQLVAAIASISCFAFLGHAEINECLSDVYFANGIDTSQQEAEDALYDINKSIATSYPDSHPSIASWQVAYNHTYGFAKDLYEASIQELFRRLNENKAYQYPALAVQYSGDRIPISEFRHCMVVV